MIKRPMVLQHHIKHRLDLFQTKCNQRMTELLTCLSEYVNELAYQLYDDLQHDGGLSMLHHGLAAATSAAMLQPKTESTASTNGDGQPQTGGDAKPRTLYSSDDDIKDFDYFGDNCVGGDVALSVSDLDDDQTEADRKFQMEFMRHIARDESATDAAGNAATKHTAADSSDSDDYFRTFEEEAAAAATTAGSKKRRTRGSSGSKKKIDSFFAATDPAPAPKPKRIKKPPRTEPRPLFNCDLCSFTSVSKMCVVTHRRATHQISTPTEKLFECDICAKRVCTKLAMESHMRTHTGERPFMCEVCCERFKQMGSLLRHKRGHEANREYECPLCDKAYFQKQDWKVHMQAHTGVRPQKCPVCARGFWKRFHVLKHLQKVHGVADAEQAALIYPPKVPERVYVSRRKKPLDVVATCVVDVVGGSGVV